MLDVRVSIVGDQVVIQGINGLGAAMLPTIQRGLATAAQSVHRNAMTWLNGPGRTIMKATTRKRGQSDSLGARPGSYPVPVMTGNLKRLLNFLNPGQSKNGFSAGPLQGIVYDSAAYASVIHDGSGTSSAYGKRPFIDDAFAAFNGAAGVAAAIETELAREITSRGL